MKPPAGESGLGMRIAGLQLVLPCFHRRVERFAEDAAMLLIASLFNDVSESQRTEEDRRVGFAAACSVDHGGLSVAAQFALSQWYAGSHGPIAARHTRRIGNGERYLACLCTQAERSEQT